MKKPILILIIISLLILTSCANNYPCEVSFDTRDGLTHKYVGNYAQASSDNTSICCAVPGYKGSVNKALKNNAVQIFCVYEIPMEQTR